MFVITTGWGCFECSKSPAVDIYISILKPAHLTWTCSYGTGIHMYFHAHSICAAYILFSSIPFHGNPNITGLWIPMKMGWWSSSNDWVNPLHNLTIAHIPSRNPWISIGSILFWVPMEHIYTISGVFQVYIYICVCVKLYVYVYIRATPGFCPGVAAYISTIHTQMILQITVIPMGKITKVLGTINQTRSKHPKFLWEKQKQHNIWNFYEKNRKGTRKF